MSTLRTLVVGVATLLLVTGCDDTTSEPSAWTQAFDTTSTGAFMCTWGASADRIWAVGGQPDQREVFSFDGTAWTQAEVPDGPLLNWVHGADDVLWFVGNDGQALKGDGSNIETTETGVTAPLWGVWAASASEAWAVGGDAIATGEADPVLLHWKDQQWTRIPIPDTDRSFRALFKVWGTSPSNVYAVGSRGIILHYNGEVWSQQLSGTARDLVSLWGTGPDEILVAGGRANGVLIRWDGQSWTNHVLEGEPGMNGIWMDPNGRATVVGIQGRILSVAPGGFEYIRENNSDRTLLHGVWGTGEGHRIAVGGTLDSSPPWSGTALEIGP